MSTSDNNHAMIETYLEVVAAQLPKDQAEDITAELRDEILARMEDREAALGRGLNEAEVEDLLREVGHPLMVAARYGSQPKSLVGPELYPWWMFAVRIGVMALVALAVVRFVSGALFADMHVGEAFGHAIGGFVKGLMSVIGGLTFAAWVIERQPEKPEFLTKWKVRDLDLFAWSGSLERSALEFLRGNVQARDKAKGTPMVGRSDFSPVAGAATSAVFTLLVLSWWIGALGGVHIYPARLINGYDIGEALREVHALLYWPVSAILTARVMFDAVRVLTGSPVRLTAAGDLGFAFANMGLFVWIWTASPLAELIRVSSVSEFWQRLLMRESWYADSVPTLLMAIVVFGFIGEALRAIQALATLYLGRKPGRNPVAA